MYDYLKGLVNSYKNMGYENYLIFYNDISNTESFSTEIEKSDITCYFAKSPILQNSDYAFTVEDECVVVTLKFNTIISEVIKRQDTNLLLEEFEEVIVPNNSYVFTNAEVQTTAGFAVNVYPSFCFNENIQTNTNLTFTNFMLVLIFATFFVTLLFRKLIFGG